MLALTVEVFANDPLVAPDVSFEDTTLVGQKKLLFGVGDGPSNKFLKMANLVLNAAAPRLKDQFLEALGDIFRWRILCHHDSGKALYTNLQLVYAGWYDKMVKENREELTGIDLRLSRLNPRMSVKVLNKIKTVKKQKVV